MNIEMMKVKDIKHYAKNAKFHRRKGGEVK